MDARIRSPDAPEGLRFACDATFLSGIQLLNLITRYGDLDVSLVPAGTRGYMELAANALPITVKGMIVRVAALEDVIRSKEAANRPKDQRVLPILRQLQEELRRREKA